MPLNSVQVSRLIQSLQPKSQEELSVFQTILGLVQTIASQHDDLALGSLPTRDLSVASFAVAEPISEQALFELVSSETRRFLHGLIEAMVIYRTIYGQGLTLGTLEDASLAKLRQLRDMCLDEVHWSTY